MKWKCGSNEVPQTFQRQTFHKEFRSYTLRTGALSGIGLSIVSRILECPINVENKSHFSSMSASSDHLGHHFAYGFKGRLLGDFPAPPGSQTHTLPQTPSLFQKFALGIQSR